MCSNGDKKSAQYSHHFKPVMQSLYVDLRSEPNAKAQRIHLGFRYGIKFLHEHLCQLREIGINHVALNLSLQNGDLSGAMQSLGDELQDFLRSET